MQVIDGLVYEHEEISVKYRERKPIGPSRHLVVVFSGFRPKGYPYDLGPASTSGIECHILWIQDDFDDGVCFYMRDASGYGISRAVNALIEAKLFENHINRSCCTLLGFSKGASAAIFFAYKYGYKNLVASAPRIYIGSGNLTNRPRVVQNMTGLASPENASFLDTIIPNLLVNASPPENIYLFSSLSDELHSTETGKHLTDFRRCRNFNYFECNTEFVAEHHDVTIFSLPIILSIVALLGKGLSPAFGEQVTGVPSLALGVSSELISLQRESMSLEQHGISFAVRGKTIAVRGAAFLRGYSAGRPIDVRSRIRLLDHSQTVVAEWNTKHVANRRNSGRFFSDVFCDYLYSGFECKVDFSDFERLPSGDYIFEIYLIQMKQESFAQMSAKLSGRRVIVVAENKYILSTFDGGIKLTKKRTDLALEQVPAGKPVKFSTFRMPFSRAARSVVRRVRAFSGL